MSPPVGAESGSTPRTSVASHPVDTTAWDPTVVIAGSDLPDEVSRLKQAEGGDPAGLQQHRGPLLPAPRVHQQRHVARGEGGAGGGAIAGLGGTWFTLDAVGSFDENMTAGRGFIALAALIFGRWHPVGAFVAALVFGFAEELQVRLALLDTPIASELLLMTPYLVTIIVVAGLVGRSRAPAADGQVYPAG